METESPAGPSSKRSRPILLILLGVLVAAFLLMRLGGSTGPGPLASNPSRASQPGAGDAEIDPSVLEVRLESLADDRPGPGESDRNPFRFRPKAAPPPPAQPPSGSGLGPVAEVPSQPQAETVPAITVKFLGTMDMPDGSKLAVLTDCSGSGRRTDKYREGQAVFGQYRLVKIGLQSVIIEHLDGRGRTTLAKTGQECVWK
ncbi:MAG: hypothetical protein ACRD15_14715 [Vicinamibacterales bacterium]